MRLVQYFWMLAQMELFALIILSEKNFSKTINFGRKSILKFLKGLKKTSAGDRRAETYP